MKKIKKQSLREVFKTSKIIKDTTLKKTIPHLVIFFKPDNYLNSLASINGNSLAQLGFKWVIINTNIKSPNNKRIKQLKIWIDNVRNNGIKILVLTNRPKRIIEKNLSLLNIKYDAYISGALKPFVLKRRKLLKIVGSLEYVYMICNDFLFDVPTANVLRIENTVIKSNLLHERIIDQKINNYQKKIVVYFLKRNNMLNELEVFQANSSIYNDYL